MQMTFCSAFTAVVSIAAAASALAVEPLPLAPGFPVFADAPGLTADCDRQLERVAGNVTVLQRRAVDRHWPAAWDDLGAAVEDASSAVQFVVNVHPDAAVREAAQACELRWQAFASTLGQDEMLYRAARRAPARDAIDRALLRDAIDNFEDAGVGLPPAQRQRAKRITDRLGELSQQFSRQVREDTTRVAFTTEELAGVPVAVWQDKPRSDAGQVLLGVDAPTYVNVIEQADSAVARERMYRARNTVGGAPNLALLAELTTLRREYARLFGFPSYADFKLRRRMVVDTATAQRFLDEVKTAVVEREELELAQLRQAKSQHLGSALEATRLERWDVAYYTERVRRERYNVDQEAFRPYFPPQQSLLFVMKLAERLLGVRYTHVPATLWHADAQAYLATDVASGLPLAMLYVDLYPRDGKYNHAAVWPIRSSATRLHRTAQAALVVNFNRQGLSLDELETLLHEMGHALHNNLSATRHVSQAGTSVLQDFVEAPSQMLEDWVYDKRVLALFQEVCPSCQPVPDALLDKAIAARDYGKGIRTARQHLYASYDLALNSAAAEDPLALWQRMESATPIGHVPGTQLPASFEHLAGGYAAGYYGYLWSLVVALDLRTAFTADRLDAAAGRRYRQAVLAQGSQQAPRQLLRHFLGRETNAKAFFKDLQK